MTTTPFGPPAFRSARDHTARQHTALKWSRQLLGDVIHFVVPSDCPGCGSEAGAPCPACAAVLLQAMPRVVHTDTLAGPPVVAAAAYEDPRVRAMVVAHKERGRRGLTTPLGGALADAIAAAVDLSASRRPSRRAPIVIVPVPSRPSAVRARGQDTVAALAVAAARRLSDEGVPAASQRLLKHRRRVRDQVGLRTADRYLNLADAMVARPLRSLGPTAIHPLVVVVDDITTSGATVTEAMRALRAAGVRVGVAATVASARPVAMR